MGYKRRNTNKIRVGDLHIGGDAPITVQSMTNTDTRDVRATVGQIARLDDAGCDIVRVAVPDMEAAEAVGRIKKAVRIPLVADIHFDYRLALECLKGGADKIRLNPGNIGGPERVRAVAEAARARSIPIRIGVNAGSLEEDILRKYGRHSPEGMAESALRHAKLLEDLDFDLIAFSLKASGVPVALEAYRLMAQKTKHPLHIGITEAGTLFSGTVKSSVGIGSLLSEGIGDTLRVSLTADPAEEVRVGIEILKALDIRKSGPELISCPMCGRCGIDLVRIAGEVEARLGSVKKDIKIAVMGCVVNGPGEAKDADIGIAGGKGEALLFRKGAVIGKIPEADIVERLFVEIEKL